MDRIAILVDAGYLLGQAVQILSAKASRSRSDLKITDPKGLIELLIKRSTAELNNNNLLRVYWYDGVANSLSQEHRAIVDIDDVQLRAGTINGKGQQKGVDSKIVTDLIELATHHAMSDAVVVTGDGDLAIGIEIAQRYGVRMAVMGVEDMGAGVRHSQSFEVTSIADRVIRIAKSDIDPFLAYTPRATSAAQPIGASPPVATPPIVTPAVATATPAAGDIDAVVGQFLASQNPPVAKNVVSASGSIDGALDRALIYFVFQALHQGKLTSQQKIDIRASFRRQLALMP